MLYYLTEFSFCLGKGSLPASAASLHRAPGGSAPLAALLLLLEQIPVHRLSGPALGSICNNTKYICLALYVNLQRLIAGGLGGAGNLSLFYVNTDQSVGMSALDHCLGPYAMHVRYFMNTILR